MRAVQDGKAPLQVRRMPRTVCQLTEPCSGNRPCDRCILKGVSQKCVDAPTKRKRLPAGTLRPEYDSAPSGAMAPATPVQIGPHSELHTGLSTSTEATNREILRAVLSSERAEAVWLFNDGHRTGTGAARVFVNNQARTLWGIPIQIAAASSVCACPFL